MLATNENTPTASATARRPAARVFPLRALIGAAALLAILLQGAMWRGGIAAHGGLDLYLRERSDFLAVLTGGLMIREGAGDRLYDLAAQHAFQSRLLQPYVTPDPGRTLPNSHPPLESLFAAATMGGSLAVSYALWALLSVAAFIAGLALLARAAPVSPKWRAPLLLTCCAYHPFFLTLWTGQSSTLVFLGLVGTYAALRARREWLAGAALALAVLKPQLALGVLLLLASQRRWRPLLALAAIWGVIALALMPILGVGWPIAYLQLLGGANSWGAELYEYPPLMHNWQGLLSHILGGSAPRAIRPLAVGCSLLTAALLAWAWWRTCTFVPRRADVPWALRDDLRWSLTIVATLLLSQHLYHHDLVVLVIPAWLIAARALAGTWGRAHDRAWLIALPLASAIPLATFFVATAPAVIVPSVLTMAALGGALLREVGAGRGAPPSAGAEAPPEAPAPLAIADGR